MYDFKLDPLKGKHNKVADALSRRADYLGALETEFGIYDDVSRSMEEAYQENAVMSEIIRKLEAKDKANSNEFELVDDLLFLKKAGNKRTGTALTALAELLAEKGFEVTLLCTQQQQSGVRKGNFWKQQYRKMGIQLTMLPPTSIGYDVPQDIAIRKKDIMEWIARFSKDWLGGEQGGWVAESVNTGTSQVPHQFRLMSMEQDTGALPRRSARIAVRARPAVPPRPKRFSRRTTPAASSTTLTVQDTTGDLPACPVREASEPLADYRGRLQAFTDAVAPAEAQQAAAEAERQRLANEAAAEAQRTAETDEAARNRRNATSTESLIASEHQWTTVLQGMIFVPTETQAEPTQAEAERSNLATVMLNVMRGVMWNNKLLQAHLHAERRQRQQYQQDLAAVTADVHDAAMQQQQQQQLMNSTISRINGIEAKASAAPGCTTDATKQINERIDHVITIIGDIGVFNAPDTISSTVAAIKTDITKLQTRPDAATKTFKMPHFDICKFDDYNKSDAVTWWQRFLTEASCRTVPANDMLKALYLQLIGGAQAWMNHLAATHKCTIAELHTHIMWKEFEQLWFTRFMVRNVVKAAMNEVYTCSQGNMPTRDWTTKWQKIVTTPGFDLTFPNQRSEFFSRSCAGLRSALGNEYDYTTFEGILDRANLVIQTDDKAANERQSQPHYVAKQAYQRPAHNNAVISEETDNHHAAAASSSDGGIVAALPPKRPKRVRKNKATQETAATGAGQPWTAYKITKEVYDLRHKYGYCLWCNGVTHVTAQCPEKGKARADTVKNAGPLSPIDDLLERLGGAKFFSKLDLKSGYHQLEIRQEDRYKTAFKTRYGHFEWLVMPFGLTNAPTTFQAAMTTEFRHMLDRFVLIYLDDILVYSRSLDEHVEHLRSVLEQLQQAKYIANGDKCEFAWQELEYLGHYVTPQGIRPLADKIEAIRVWPEPTNTTDVRSFMGLAGYY
ncbi:hypothetical protein CBR_g18634 [Chara braunii]|uniref:Reverse transcriptase domain-containing protein n=1 Tax=Chara braunii TaxID=69332 RepID=A0A388JT94_CHABU|nr:hypothetical protein CBR_g18634 [Chara braunii]|eukprot:GBG61039.1 hypothetical protein CBR_g18634 [Chara braunii]